MDEFRERMAALEAFAPTVGLEYSAEDTVGLDDAPFRLIQSGHRHLIGNVMWGWWRVCEAIAFDLHHWSLAPGPYSTGLTTRELAFTCATTTIPLDLPWASIEPRGEVVLGAHLRYMVKGWTHRLVPGFRVATDDEPRTSSLLRGRIANWLHSSSEDYAFEVTSLAILCFAKQREPEEISRMLDVLVDFRELLLQADHAVRNAGAGE